MQLLTANSRATNEKKPRQVSRLCTFETVIEECYRQVPARETVRRVRNSEEVIGRGDKFVQHFKLFRSHACVSPVLDLRTSHPAFNIAKRYVVCFWSPFSDLWRVLNLVDDFL